MTISTGLLGLFVCAQAHAEDASVTTLYNDNHAAHRVWKRIVELSGVKAAFVAKRQDAARQDFVQGDLLLSCCAIPEWRIRPSEEAVQTFTEPFFPASEHLILRASTGEGSTEHPDLSRLTMALVRGFTYVQADEFGATKLYDTIPDAMKAVAEGEVDATLLMNQEFFFQQRQRRLPLTLGPIYTQSNLSARVHKSRPDLLAVLNKTILTLQESGRLDQMVGAALRGQRLSPDS